MLLKKPMTFLPHDKTLTCCCERCVADKGPKRPDALHLLCVRSEKYRLLAVQWKWRRRLRQGGSAHAGALLRVGERVAPRALLPAAEPRQRPPGSPRTRTNKSCPSDQIDDSPCSHAFSPLCVTFCTWCGPSAIFPPTEVLDMIGAHRELESTGHACCMMPIALPPSPQNAATQLAKCSNPTRR